MLALQSSGLIRLETAEWKKSFLLSKVGDIASRMPQGRNSSPCSTEEMYQCSWENRRSC